MRKIFVLVMLAAGCSPLPYMKLSDELSVRQYAYPVQMGAVRAYTIKTDIKNTSDDLLDLKVVCHFQDQEKIYNIKVMPRSETVLPDEKFIWPHVGKVSAECKWYSR